MTTPLKFWIFFHIGVFAILAFDLFRKTKTVSFKEASFWSILWVSLSLGFNGLLWHWKGADKALEFFTGYVIEYSLSVDNIFVFVLIFSYFKVPGEYQHRVLFWGVAGALVMRGIMIGVGSALVERFHWILYLFGAFLVFTGIKMIFHKEDDAVNMEGNPLVRLCRRFLPISAKDNGPRFLARENGKWTLTPLALILATVESTDLIFAVDSIPAIFAITTDPFIIYTSNVCAIMGLRSLYFLIARVVDRFIYLKYGLAVVLSFIGVKMLAAKFWHISTAQSLSVVGVVLGISIAASMLATRKSHTGG
ncbi:MAG: TerC family protein [Verrucomicrobiae bacterium]|nr:TerC family protein [Verrucomicrobiae bacterium]